jgi:hypothetical protein
VDTGSREENGSKQKPRARVLIPSEPEKLERAKKPAVIRRQAFQYTTWLNRHGAKLCLLNVGVKLALKAC